MIAKTGAEEERVKELLHTANKAQSASQYDTRKDDDPDKKVEAGQTPKESGH